MQGQPLTRPSMRFDHRWHVAINRHAEAVGHEGIHWMYEAKTLADEVPRLALLFQWEREGKLAKVHQQCSHSLPEPVQENYLTCCLGTKCRECPHLQALDAADLSPEERDIAKAWTCAGHIVSEGGDAAREGYVLTVDDRMYWDNLYRSLAGTDYQPEENDNA